VVIYQKSKKAAVAVATFLIVIGMVIAGFMAALEGFTAGIYTLENYLLY
jgi:hypothetical protein